MKQLKKNHVARAMLGGVVALATASMALAAGGGAAGGGGGGHGGGGGGGAAAGGAHAGGGAAAAGGGHAVAPSGGGEARAGNPTAVAPSAPAAGARTESPSSAGRVTSPAVNNGQVQSSGAISGGQVQGPAAGGALPTSGENTRSLNSAANNRINPSNERAGVQATARQNHPYNPYVPEGNRNRQNYGVVYGSPYYPFSYGWDSGWYGGYGTQYGYPGYSYNNAYPAYLPYDNYNEQNNQASLAANPPVTGNTPIVSGGQPVNQQVNQAQLQPIPQSGPAVQVDETPAMVQANSAVAQTQAAFDAERQRVIASLAGKPEYQEAVARKKAAAAQVTQAKTESSPQAVNAAADKKLEAGDEVTKMEAAAVAADPTAAAAKGRFEQAVTDRDTTAAQMKSQTRQR